MKSSWLTDISNIYADNNLSAFQKVLIIKALRPDYLHTALSQLAANQLGEFLKFLQVLGIIVHVYIIYYIFHYIE